MSDLIDYMANVARLRTAPNGWRHSCVEDLLLAAGWRFESPAFFTNEERRQLRQVLECHDNGFAIGSCYKNAFMLAAAGVVVHVPLRYCEGLATSIMPLRHAWCSLNGKPVDVTWSGELLGTAAAQRRHNREARPGALLQRIERNAEEREYVGVAVPFVDIAALCVEAKASVSVLDDWQRAFPLLQSGLLPSWRGLLP